jgi:hypothetical protein
MKPSRVPASTLFDDETADVVHEVGTIIGNPDEWLDEPNDRFEGRPPRALINTDEEQRLRDLIRAVKHGLVS